MKCQYCCEREGIYEIDFDKNCETAMMCEMCAEQFKPSEKIIVNKITGKKT